MVATRNGYTIPPLKGALLIHVQGLDGGVGRVPIRLSSRRARTLASARRPQRAQALVELALILPVVLLILLGLFDLGRAFVFGVSVQDGVRSAARLAARGALDSSVTKTQVYQRLIDASSPALAGCTIPSNPGTSMTCTDSTGGSWTLSIAYHSSNSSGQGVEIKAVGNVALLSGFSTRLFNLTLKPITVQGDADMVIL